MGARATSSRDDWNLVLASNAQDLCHLFRCTLGNQLAAAFPDTGGDYHFLRRASSDKVISLAEQYEQLAPGQLLADPASSPRFAEAWALSRADSFARVG